MSDALPIGQLIAQYEDQHRDAIHIAVAPVIAGEELYPGDHIAFEEGSQERVISVGKFIGIVDPFLPGMVKEGERFWMFLYPQTITSLRHEWTHPAFTEEAADRGPSVRWIQQFAEKVRQSYEGLMDAADRWVNSGRTTCDNGQNYFNASHDEWCEFWDHYKIVTGRACKPEDREHPFHCAC